MQISWNVIIYVYNFLTFSYLKTWNFELYHNIFYKICEDAAGYLRHWVLEHTQLSILKYFKFQSCFYHVHLHRSTVFCETKSILNLLVLSHFAGDCTIWLQFLFLQSFGLFLQVNQEAIFTWGLVVNMKKTGNHGTESYRKIITDLSA